MNKQQEETLREHLRILDALRLDLERAGRVERDGLRIYNEALTALRRQESTIIDNLREALAGECPRCAAPVSLHHGRPEPTCECDNT